MTSSASNEPTELERRLAAEAEEELAEGVEEVFDEEGDDELEPIDLQTLVEDHEAVLKERDDLQDQLLRARAEFDNFRKRTARESQELRATAAANLVRELLPIADNLARALEHVTNTDDTFARGVQLVSDQFAGALAKAGVERIASVGEAFDPTIHDALAQQPSDEVPAGNIVLEYEPGYRMGEMVIRPAKVVVSAGPEGGAAEDGSASSNDAGQEE